MPKLPIRYGLIGAGMMGREHIRNLALIPEVKLVAICDPDEEQRQLSSACAPEASLHAEISEFLNRDDLEAIVIATPNFTHFEILAQILEGPPRALLVEKPAVTTEEQVREIRTRATHWDQPIWIGMEYRYMPPIAQFIQRCHRGDVGPLRMLSIREHRFPFLEKVGDWNRFNQFTGGTLVEKCCHFFDLMCLILEDQPVSVFASGAIDVNHLDERYEQGEPDIIDNAYVILDFASGKRAMLDLCMFAEGAWFQEELTAVGDAARIDCRIPGPARFWPGERSPEIVFSPRNPKNPQQETIEVDEAILAAGDHQGATYYQHLRFLESVAHSGPVEVDLTDGLRAVLIGLAAQQSIVERRVVPLGPALDLL